jgi:hypothetical protein
VDRQVNFNWGTNSPDPAVPADQFGKRRLGASLGICAQQLLVWFAVHHTL